MKKPAIPLLTLLTVLFAAFTLGLFIGRNQAKAPVTLSIPPALQTEPATIKIAPADSTEENLPESFPIDINTASKETFQALPGIGGVLAQRIIAYRDEHGPFTHVEALMNVEGIGEKTLEDMLTLITIGG